jgi:hypothetical protein
MRLNRIFQHELSEVFQLTSFAGTGNWGDQAFTDLTSSEHKAVQNLYAKALRRAVKRARTGGGRSRATA